MNLRPPWLVRPFILYFVFSTYVILYLTYAQLQQRNGLATKLSSSSSSGWLFSLRGGSEGSARSERERFRQLRLVQVQVVHRHGDRSPITPMANESYWKQQLVQPEVLDQIAAGTRLLVPENTGPTHAAGGRGSFGQLTTLGLLQMVELGTKLRDQLVEPYDPPNKKGYVRSHSPPTVLSYGGNSYHLTKTHLFEPKSFGASSLKVVSTNFPRTIQSVRGVLVGLFPDGLNEGNVVEIDCRHTDHMIPDPQPRRTREQVELETELSRRPHILARDKEMAPLATRVTNVLRDGGYLGTDYASVSFGIGEESTEELSTQPLPWVQLAEITKCLSVRNLLPPSVTEADQQAVSDYAAWAWFESLRNPRLSYLAMNDMLRMLWRNARRVLDDGDGNDLNVVRLHVWSAHDSTLIGLLCALRLEQPSQWPEYGSYFKMELLAADVNSDNADDDFSNTPKYYVRFSLDDITLKQGSNEMIPFELLEELVLRSDGTE